LTEFDRVLAKLWESGSQGKPWRLIKEIYRNVQNKVLFNDYEFDYFDQEYGVKQGFTLPPPPILFSDNEKITNVEI
jgi:hypothetical protein